MEKRINSKENGFNISFTEDGKQMLIFDNKADNLICRTSFYDDLSLNNEDKKKIGAAMLDVIFTSIENKKVIDENTDWTMRKAAFLDAYNIEEKSNNINRTTVIWLMSEILGLSQEEANNRFDMMGDLLDLPEFKDKKSKLINRIYLSDYHLKKNSN